MMWWNFIKLKRESVYREKKDFIKKFRLSIKEGKPKLDDPDILQVAAQALCLEEMLCCTIPYGYIYYGETRASYKK